MYFLAIKIAVFSLMAFFYNYFYKKTVILKPELKIGDSQILKLEIYIK
jgi:hypothetical protein